MTEEKPKICDRCGEQTNYLIPHTVEDDYGENRKMMICWNCDHDVINGGDMFEDEFDIACEREEQDYLDDPINNSPPWFYNRS